MANIRSFPNNQDEYTGAEDVMRWLHGRSSGVFGADGNASVAPVLDAMAVTVSDGNGWISNNKNYGVVWWIDNEATNGSKIQLTVDMADAVLPRIDRVVISWQTTDYVALPELKILKGTAASTPVAPTLTNNNVLRQISLASIHIPAGATSITSAMITDERLNPAVCGLVTNGVGVDTSVMQAQFSELLTRIQNELDGLNSGTEVLMKSGGVPTPTKDDQAANKGYVDGKHFDLSVTIPTSGWTTTTDGAYSYINISVAGILSTDNPVVDFDGGQSQTAAEQLDKLEWWATVFKIATYDGSIRVMATEIPTVTVPIILKVVR